MKRFTTQGIVLRRTDFGEADRIITFLTPDHGKVKAIAKGVRKAKAKLAGSVEPFGISDITVLRGRKDIDTLMSARLASNYGNIVKDLDRTQLAYEAMLLLDKITAEHPEEAFFRLLGQTLASFDDLNIDEQLTALWFKMQLLRLSGHTPNLSTDESGKKLSQSKTYGFDYEKMRFTPAEKGEFSANHIKFLRLGFGHNLPKALQRIAGAEKLIKDCQVLIDATIKSYIQI